MEFYQLALVVPKQRNTENALWVIGPAKKVDPQAGFLHDGRARTLMEAILWHRGDAENAKQRVINMPSDERKALMAFLDSL